ncbi:hypothetical protein YC2023_030023 [Brassica napus]
MHYTDVVAVSRDETYEISIFFIIDLKSILINNIKKESGRIMLHLTVIAHAQFNDNNSLGVGFLKQNISFAEETMEQVGDGRG